MRRLDDVCGALADDDARRHRVAAGDLRHDRRIGDAQPVDPGRASRFTSLLKAQLQRQTDVETFFAQAPAMNPARSLIKGTIRGVHVEEIEEPTMRDIRYLDKLIDELAKGKAIDKILRKP